MHVVTFALDIAGDIATLDTPTALASMRDGLLATFPTAFEASVTLQAAGSVGLTAKLFYDSAPMASAAALTIGSTDLATMSTTWFANAYTVVATASPTVSQEGYNGPSPPPPSPPPPTPPPSLPPPSPPPPLPPAPLTIEMILGGAFGFGALGGLTIIGIVAAVMWCKKGSKPAPPPATSSFVHVDVTSQAAARMP